MSLFSRNAAQRIMCNNGKGNTYNNRGGQSQSGRNNKPNNKKKRTMDAEKILRRFDESEDAQQKECRNTSNKNVSDTSAKDVKEFIAGFNGDFEKNLDKPAECRRLIGENFIDLCAALKYYYDPKFVETLPEMNRLLDLMSTNHFANILLAILKQGELQDDWDTAWKDAAFALSILLDSCAEKMKDETVQIYVTDILASNGMWRSEINQLMDRIGITEELAIDLIVGLPVRPEDMTDLIMRYTYKNFLCLLLDHAEDNIEVLDRAAQKKLFDFFFEDGKNTKLACKVIGRYLGDPDILKDTELSGAALLIYEEFKVMLYEKLETYDVHHIVFVLKYIVEQKKRSDKKQIIFSAEDAAKYDTIRKAIMETVKKDDSAKGYLV